MGGKCNYPFFLYKDRVLYRLLFIQYKRETFSSAFFSVFSVLLPYLIWYQSTINFQTWKSLVHLSIVSQPLTGENFNSWSRSMLMALSAKNKLCLIDGSLPKPSDSSTIFKAWTRCNDMVLSWIINSVSKKIAASIIYIDNAEAMWKDLNERFSQGNGPQIFQLQKSIAVITQGSNSVSSYYTQLKSVWDELQITFQFLSVLADAVFVVVPKQS